MMGIGAMSTEWIFSSTFLPYTGEPIDFLLEDRDDPIPGTFANGSFHSRWAHYDAERVVSWRQAVADPAHATITEPRVARRSTWLAPLARLARFMLVGGDDVAAAPTAPPGHSRTIARPMSPVATVSSTTSYRPDSNQMSS